MTTREHIISVIEGERYPRMWTFKEHIGDAASEGTIRKYLNELIKEGVVRKHHRARGASYYTLTDNKE